MKSKYTSLIVWGVFALALLCLPVIAVHAQTVAAPAANAPAVTAPALPTAGITAENIVTWLTPLIVPLLIAGVKKIAPNIPSFLLPIIAPVLGVLIGIVQNYATAQSSNLWVAALLGLAGVGIREVKDQLTALGSVESAST